VFIEQMSCVLFGFDLIVVGSGCSSSCGFAGLVLVTISFIVASLESSSMGEALVLSVTGGGAEH